MSDHGGDSAKATAGASSGGGGSNLKMLILFGVVGLVLMFGSIGGTLYFTGFFSGGASRSAAPHEEEHKEIDYSKFPPKYLTIKPGFIANAIEGDRLHFVLVELSFMFRNPTAEAGITANMAAIRNGVREALSGYQYEEVLGANGIERLRVAAQTAVNEQLEQRHLPIIDALYFTSFVVQ